MEVPLKDKDFIELEKIVDDMTNIIQNCRYPKPASVKKRCPDCCYKIYAKGLFREKLLQKLTRRVDLSTEPHSFAKSDFDETNPYIKAIIEAGERII
ncbi:MAG: hypothetical protein SRB2_01675 [Desulfobacteraceae bacterium Eth-SRB2]|nr:MAG: hypothetical protein SRB2_01675 [Desulfobacteraceae bacterium Eth-SRB2]